MIKEPRVPLYDLIMSLGEAVDLVSPLVAEIHKKVAYIAFRIGEEINLPEEDKNDLVLAGILHDIGALSLKERLDIMEFHYRDEGEHTKKSYLFLEDFEPFSEIARIVRFHHYPWNNGAGIECDWEPVPITSHILNLADRVSVLIDKRGEILDQVDTICEKVRELRDTCFAPNIVDAFAALAEKEYFWFDVVSPSLGDILARQVNLETIVLDLDDLLGLADLFSNIIDFRSKFTATHSCGVAAIAENLAGVCGFSQRECLMIKIAGYLHDLGKLAVPTEILEKPGKLTKREFDIVRRHPYYTYHTLEPIEDLDVINTWGAFHHERLDGSGYPFHHSAHDLSIGSRIVAVADVCSALLEDRPYRRGMTASEVMEILQDMARDSKLDYSLVSLLRENFAELNAKLEAAMAVSAEEYRRFSRLQHA